MRIMKEVMVAEPVLGPAPGAERYVAIDFVNTTMALPGGQFVDLLAAPEAVNRWLAEHGLAPVDAGLREVCAARLRAMRDHVRTLFAARVAGEPARPEAVAAVNDALNRAPTAALLHWDGADGPYRAVRPSPDQALDRALAALADNAADLLTGPDAERLAACDSPPCIRYLLRHGRRHWCSTRCGDRARAARAYARRVQARTP
jgi:predicted RNA-binding Zn ribbon-like protein